MPSIRHIIPRLIFVVAMASIAAIVSCTAIHQMPEDDQEDASVMMFRLNINAAAVMDTKSSISGQEGVYSMQLLCFDENGLYIGLGFASVSPVSQSETSGSRIHGTLDGTVPAGTARVHFIANAGIIPSDGWPGLTESIIINSLVSSVSNTHIVYWGYHKETTAAAMAQWLDAPTRNTVYLLRDRAKVTMTEPDYEVDHNTSDAVEEKITSVSFCVSDGLSYGQIAPFDKSNLSSPFVYDNTGAGTEPNVITLPSNQSHFTGTESEMVPHDGAQYLFEDENSLTSPIKVILKVTYDVTTSGGTASVVKYHQVMLMKSDFTLYKIKRNHRYNIVIGILPADVGYDTFEDALEGAPSNNQTVVVQEIIPEVTYGEYMMSVTGGTSVIFQNDPDASDQYAYIDFSYLKDGAADPDMTPDKFSATWMTNLHVASPDVAPEIVDGDEPGHYKIKILLYKPITTDLKYGKIILLDHVNGLARYINIYSITAFEFNASFVATGDSSNPYSLMFTIPDNYPEALFPFDVRIATRDFTATISQNNSKALGVIVEETMPVIGEDWNYWFTYEVEAPGTYSVYLKKATGRTGTIPLYLQAPCFGTLDSDGELVYGYERLTIDI